MILYYPSGFQAGAGGGGGSDFFFFFSREKLELSVEDRSVPCFGEAGKHQGQSLSLVWGSALL